MTDLVRKSRFVTPHHASLFLNLMNGVAFLPNWLAVRVGPGFVMVSGMGFGMDLGMGLRVRFSMGLSIRRVPTLTNKCEKQGTTNKPRLDM